MRTRTTAGSYRGLDSYQNADGVHEININKEEAPAYIAKPCMLFFLHLKFFITLCKQNRLLIYHKLHSTRKKEYICQIQIWQNSGYKWVFEQRTILLYEAVIG